MANTTENGDSKRVSGHGRGTVDTVLSVDAVAKEAAQLAKDRPTVGQLDALIEGDSFVSIDGLLAGYGKMEILHDLNLRLGKGQSLCLIGPNGAGKSTILHSIYGFTNIGGGHITIGGDDVTDLTPNDKLKNAGIAYILQDNSVFPDMTVEENLLMGGYLLPDMAEAKRAADRVFEKYGRLAERRNQRANGGIPQNTALSQGVAGHRTHTRRVIIPRVTHTLQVVS